MEAQEVVDVFSRALDAKFAVLRDSWCPLHRLIRTERVSVVEAGAERGENR